MKKLLVLILSAAILMLAGCAGEPAAVDPTEPPEITEAAGTPLPEPTEDASILNDYGCVPAVNMHGVIYRWTGEEYEGMSPTGSQIGELPTAVCLSPLPMEAGTVNDPALRRYAKAGDDITVFYRGNWMLFKRLDDISSVETPDARNEEGNIPAVWVNGAFYWSTGLYYRGEAPEPPYKGSLPERAEPGENPPDDMSSNDPKLANSPYVFVNGGMLALYGGEWMVFVSADAPSPTPTPVPTEEPDPTPVPTASPLPTLGPTEPPVPARPLEEGDYFAEIRANQPVKVDIDGDGREDTVTVWTSYAEYVGDLYMVTISTAARPDEPYEFATGTGWGFYGAVLDFEPSTPQKELIFTYDMEDGDMVTHAFRWKDDGSGFEMFTDYIEIMGDSYAFFNGTPQDFVFSAEEGLPMVRRTEILGTHFVRNHITVDKDGIRLLSDEFTYHYELKLKLKKDLTLTGENGKTFKAKKGEYIYGYSTDRRTWVKVRTEDGRIGRAEVTFGSADGWPILINGVKQDKYADLPYAD